MAQVSLMVLFKDLIQEATLRNGALGDDTASRAPQADSLDILTFSLPPGCPTDNDWSQVLPFAF